MTALTPRARQIHNSGPGYDVGEFQPLSRCFPERDRLNQGRLPCQDASRIFRIAVQRP